MESQICWEYFGGGSDRMWKNYVCSKLGSTQNFWRNKNGRLDIKNKLSKGREDQVRKTFSYASIEFHYPEELSEFDTLLESIRAHETEPVNNTDVVLLWEKIGNLISLS